MRVEGLMVERWMVVSVREARNCQRVACKAVEGRFLPK